MCEEEESFTELQRYIEIARSKSVLGTEQVNPLKDFTFDNRPGYHSGNSQLNPKTSRDRENVSNNGVRPSSAMQILHGQFSKPPEISPTKLKGKLNYWRRIKI
jgi:hypothetical protein